MRTNAALVSSALLIALCAASLIVNGATVTTFPSWFDEAFFADVSLSVAGGHGLMLTVIPGYMDAPAHVYGPVYFLIEAAGVVMAGLHAPTFRLVNLVAAYGTVLFLALLLREEGLPRRRLILFVAAALVDVSVNRNAVSGRMDMLAAMPVAAAAWIAHRQLAASPLKLAARAVSVALLCAAAYLTTPRALFLMPVVAVLHLARVQGAPDVSKTDRVAAIAVAGAVFATPVALWVHHVGGPAAYMHLFIGNPKTEGLIAPSFFRSAYDNIAIGALLGLTVWQLRPALRRPAALGLLLTYLAFSCFVREAGPYGAMLMPFVLAAIALLMPAGNRWDLAATSVLVAPGTALLLLRAGDLVLNAACRDASVVRQAVQPFTPPGARIVAPFKYFFLLQPLAGQLRTYEYAKPPLSAATIAAADVVIADTTMDTSVRKSGFQPVGAMTCSPRKLPLLPQSFYERSLFNETIYRKTP